MSDQAKFERMLKILISLSGSFGYTVQEIADRFGISIESVYRYLRTFGNAGFALEKKRGYYKIDRTSQAYVDLSKLVHFSEEEAYILNKAIHLIDDDNKYREQLCEKLHYLFNSEKFINKITKRESSENTILLKRAIENKEQVMLKNYRSSSSSAIRDRLVEPFKFTPRHLYFMGYDVESNTNKTFKIARIDRLIMTGNKWKFAGQHSPMEIDVFRMGGGEKTNVRFRMSLLAFNLLIEEYPMSEQFIAQINDNSYQFNGWVLSFKGIGRFVLGLLDEVEDIEPESLKSYVIGKINSKKI